MKDPVRSEVQELEDLKITYMLLISLRVGKLSYKKGKNSSISSILALKLSLTARRNVSRIGLPINVILRRKIAGKPHGNYKKLNQVD
jgi:hypothetical protein